MDKDRLIRIIDGMEHFEQKTSKRIDGMDRSNPFTNARAQSLEAIMIEFICVKDSLKDLLGPPTIALDDVIGVEAASEAWRLSPGYIKNLCAEGKIICKKIGKTWVIDKNQPNPSKSSE